MKQKFTLCRFTLESVVHGSETKIEHTAAHSGTLHFVIRLYEVVQPLQLCTILVNITFSF
jgi:hypothetical protein